MDIRKGTINMSVLKTLTPAEWYGMTIGKAYDVDKAYGAQCWDYFAQFCKHCDLVLMNLYCGLTRFAGDIWKQRYSNGASMYFEFIKPEDIREGDWLFWDKHVAFYYQGKEVGQNQNRKPQVTAIPLNRNGLLGGFRYKFWLTAKPGVADKFSKDYNHTYITTAPLNLRTGPGTAYPSITVIPKGNEVRCYGYYSVIQNVPWYYVQYSTKVQAWIGFCSSEYLKQKEGE